MICSRAKNGLVQKPTRKGDTLAQMSIFGKEGYRASRKLLSTKRLRSPLKMLIAYEYLRFVVFVPLALYSRNCVGRHGGLAKPHGMCVVSQRNAIHLSIS